MPQQSLIERLLFERPTAYRIKRFLIEVVIWRVLLAGICRMKPNPMPDLSPTFAGHRVLVAACGPGHVSTGPPINGAAEVVAFDLSWEFAATCARSRPDWKVYCGDILHMPHRDKPFDVAVLYSTLHHVPTDASAVLTELARVTSGHIVVVEGVVPPAGALRRALLLWYRLVDGGYRYYTADELDAIVDRLGLHVESKGLYSPIRHMLLTILDCRPQRPGSGATAHLLSVPQRS